VRKILVFLMLFCSVFVYSETYISGKIIEKIETLPPGEAYEQVKGYEKIKVELTSGKDNGKLVVVENPIYIEGHLNLDLKKGNRVILAEDLNEVDGSRVYYFTDRDKRGGLIATSLIFVLLTLLIAKFRGFRALVALGVVVGLIFFMFVPLITKGYSPIMLAIVVSLVSSTVTILFMTGKNRRGIPAIIGSVGGTFVAGLISYIFSNTMGITGYSTVEALNAASYLQKINMKELVSAGILLGSMGAVMDVAMSISSSLQEINTHHPEIEVKELFYSGINIGKDIIGTMINTLVLAYIGSSLLQVIMIHLQDMSSMRVFNYEFIVVEFLRAFCGSIGILIAVPLTSFVAAELIPKKKKEK